MRISNLKPAFIKKALVAYDPIGPFIYREFLRDIQKIMFLARYFKQCKLKGGTYKPMVLVNYYILIMNSFGVSSSELLFEQSDESVYPEILAMLSFLNQIPENGIMPFSFKEVSLELYGTNSDLLKDLKDAYAKK